MYLPDTDLLSLLERDNVESLPLQMHLDSLRGDEIAATIVTYE